MSDKSMQKNGQICLTERRRQICPQVDRKMEISA